MIIRRNLIFALVLLLVLLSIKVTIFTVRESYYRMSWISHPVLMPNYKYIVSASKKIPQNGRVILVPDKSAMMRGFFFFDAYYLFPRKLYMYKSNTPYSLDDVPKSFIKKHKINWIIYDHGITFKIKPIIDVKK